MGLLNRIAGKGALAAGLLGVGASSAAAPSTLAQNLERHVKAIASREHNTAHPKALEASARYIESTLADLGFKVLRQEFKAGGQPVRMRHAQLMRAQKQPVKGVWVLETIGHYSKERNSQRYPPGLEERFPDTGDCLAIVSTLEATSLVERTLAAFKAGSDFPVQGLAAPASTGGVTLSDHTSYLRQGFPALMMTDTAFMRYPHYHTVRGCAGSG